MQSEPELPIEDFRLVTQSMLRLIDTDEFHRPIGWDDDGAELLPIGGRFNKRQG